MAFSSINIGSVANDGTGDPIRTAFDKINTGLVDLDSQTYFNRRLTQSNIFVSGTLTASFANVTQRLHGNVFSANVFNAGNLTISSNITTGNIIVPPGGFIYGTVIGSTASGALDATTLGLTSPAAANVTQFNVINNANVLGGIDSVSTSTGSFTVLGGAGVTGNLHLGGNIYTAGNANVANLGVSGKVHTDLYFIGKTIYIDGSPVATSANSFSGGNVANPTRFVSTVQSTSGTTGAVRIDGGVGVAGNVNTTGNLGVVGFAGFGSSVTVIDRLTVGGSSNVVMFSNGSIRGTVVTAAQPGITSVGSLSGLSMSGNITAGSGNTFAIGDPLVPFLDVFAFRTTSTFISGQLTTASQPSITAVGTLGSLAVSGNIAAGNVSATKGTFTNVQGTILTASQTNITAVGTLGLLTVSGNIAAGNVSATKGTFTGIQGTLLTSSQPNITTVGDLGSLTVDGASTLSGSLTVAGASTLTGALNLKNNIIFEGATDNAFETTLTVTDPTADRTITLPDATTTMVGTGVTQTLTNKTIALGVNTVSGTAAQFDTACTDTNFVFDSDFTGTNQSKSANGYQKLPGGVILQWGSDTVDLIEGENRTYTFPVAFVTACYSVQVSIFGNQSASGDNGPVCVFSKSTTGFEVESMSQSDVPGINWFAIGV
jgi:hypothetical protein